MSQTSALSLAEPSHPPNVQPQQLLLARLVSREAGKREGGRLQGAGTPVVRCKSSRWGDTSRLGLMTASATRASWGGGVGGEKGEEVSFHP